MPRFRRIPPRRPTPWSRTLGFWAALAAALLALLLVAAWSERLPEPAPATAPSTAFATARAWPVLAQLADTIGYRVTGTAGAERARSYLERRLREIPGLEVQTQDVTGVRRLGRGPVAYRLRNVLARLPGRRSDAVLVSVHYDSPSESVGAADDALAVATAVEVARALAAGAPYEYTVVFNFNDAEEQGLLGAHAFLQHPWASQLRAFVNLESAGNEGKAILFQAGPGNAWLTRRLASSAPFPYGSVFGQDIFRSGLVPSQTDFAVYTREGGIPGLDIAFYRGGWAYHTALDRVSAIAPGSMQHLGENTLAVTRALAAGPLPGDVGGGASMYYDLLGLALVAYGQTTALLLAIGAALLALWAVRAATRAELAPGREVRTALGTSALGLLLGVLLGVGAAAIGPYLLGRPHGWFAHPLRGVLAFGGAALTGLLVAQWLYERRRAVRDLAPETRMVAVWSGALLLHALLVVATALAGLGVSYLFLWWTVSGAAGLLLLARTHGARWRLAAALGFLPAAALTVQATYLLVALFVPIAGRFRVPIPFDLVLGTIVALATVVLFVQPVALLQRGERLAIAAGAAGAIALGGLLATWVSFPYTPDRPQRLLVLHEGNAVSGRLAVWASDYLGPARAALALGGGGPLGRAMGADGVLYFPAPALAERPPTLELIGERTTADGARVLDLRLQPGDAYRVAVRTPPARPVRWQIATVQPAADEARRPASRAEFVSAPEGGWLLTVVADRPGPITFTLEGLHATPSPAARALIEELPRWTTANGERLVRGEVTL